jgi:membrane protease YdiL (CAAX protease family)
MLGNAMRPIRTIMLYIVGVFITAALLAPLIYLLVHSIPHAPPWLLGQPFSQYFTRIALVLAVLSLFPLAKHLGFTQLHQIGLLFSAGQLRFFFWGILGGVTSLSFITIVNVICGIRSLSPSITLPIIVTKTASTIASAITISLIEELIFRGLFFHAVKKAWNWIFAMVVSSIIFAALHYIDTKYNPSLIEWYTGIEALPKILSPLARPSVIVPGMLNLFLAGCILCYAVHHTKSLWFPIGIHAGWIIAIKLSPAFLPLAQPESAFWGSHRIVDGWFATLVLSGFSIAIVKAFRRQETKFPYLKLWG